MNINVVGFFTKGKNFRDYSPVQSSTFLGFLVCSDSKPSHLLLFFSIFLSHVGKILILSLLFAQGGHRLHVHPGIL